MLPANWLNIPAPSNVQISWGFGSAVGEDIEDPNGGGYSLKEVSDHTPRPVDVQHFALFLDESGGKFARDTRLCRVGHGL